VVISNNEISWKKRCDFAKTFCLSASQERWAGISGHIWN
jgi:hypothetical protein